MYIDMTEGMTVFNRTARAYIVPNSIQETNERTEGRRERRLSLSVVSVGGVHRPMGERTAMLHRNLKGIKIPG